MGRIGNPDTRDKIFKESVKQFLQKGMSGTVVSDITDSLNISKGTFYWYFASKDSILEEIVHTWDKNLLDGLTRVVEKTDGGFIEKFQATHKYVTSFAYQNRDLCLAFLTVSAELIGSGTKIEKKIRGAYRKFVKVFLGLVELGKREKKLKNNVDSSLTAHLIASMLNGMLFEWYLNLDTVNGRNLAIECLNFELRGLSWSEVPSKSGRGKTHTSS